MAHHAVEAMRGERDRAIRAALKAKIAWDEIMADFDISLAEIIEISEKMPKARAMGDDLRDARTEDRRLVRGR